MIPCRAVLIAAIVAVGIVSCIQIDSACALRGNFCELPPASTQTAEIAPQSTETVSRGTIEPRSLGIFTITHYCACEKCCGKSDGITATGTKATAGRTIAVDPNVIPYGAVVIIDGHEYVAEDCGGAVKGNRIDAFCASHEEAVRKGTFSEEVFVY